MFNRGLIVLIVCLLLSCGNDNKTGEVSPAIRKKITESAVNYVRDQSVNARKSKLENGIIRIADGLISYIIDPAAIATGLIDDDSNEDAIITIASYRGNHLIKNLHLILLKNGRKFITGKIIEENMKISRISDRIIFAEISTFPPDSPTYNCQVCKEIVKYRYLDGTLIKTE